MLITGDKSTAENTATTTAHAKTHLSELPRIGHAFSHSSHPVEVASDVSKIACFLLGGGIRPGEMEEEPTAVIDHNRVSV